MTRRTRIAEGVYKDRYGLAATVKVGRIQREQRFPFGTDLAVISSWRIQKRAELDEERSDGLTLVTGTLQKDAEKFLERKKGQQAYKADRAHLRAWFPKFGTWLRSAIKIVDVEQQIGRWQQANVAARTIRHRCRLLKACYKFCDGPRAKTPCDFLKLPKPPAPRPVAVPLKTIKAVAARLAQSNESKTYARFLIRATTGQRPAQIMRATPADIDTRRKLWFVRDAKHGHPIPFPLNPEALRAWKLFAAADAWGTYDTSREAEILRAHGWPDDIPPYALRSTLAIDLLLDGADLGDVQALLGHKQIQTTRAHYAPILAGRLKALTNQRTLGIVPAATSRSASQPYQRAPRRDAESLGKTRKANARPRVAEKRKRA